ncbi:MAG: hypothetical protein VXY81_15030, partial [Pseudomonadota bacterium]|nr:hypothetical protein [Pseudomonadota bacterium]
MAAAFIGGAVARSGAPKLSPDGRGGRRGPKPGAGAALHTATAALGTFVVGGSDARQHLEPMDFVDLVGDAYGFYAFALDAIALSAARADDGATMPRRVRPAPTYYDEEDGDGGAVLTRQPKTNPLLIGLGQAGKGGAREAAAAKRAAVWYSNPLFAGLGLEGADGEEEDDDEA